MNLNMIDNALKEIKTNLKNLIEDQNYKEEIQVKEHLQKLLEKANINKRLKDVSYGKLSIEKGLTYNGEGFTESETSILNNLLNICWYMMVQRQNTLPNAEEYCLFILNEHPYNLIKSSFANKNSKNKNN